MKEIPDVICQGKVHTNEIDFLGGFKPAMLEDLDDMRMLPF